MTKFLTLALKETVEGDFSEKKLLQSDLVLDCESNNCFLITNET